ncbi:hypothetical protein QM332_32805, partial [Pseudomonas aeruginosa]|nr:hypothetical protein [Pseudomonas aeruginosa]
LLQSQQPMAPGYLQGGAEERHQGRRQEVELTAEQGDGPGLALAYDLLVREGAWLPWLDALLAGYPAPANAAVGAALEQLREADEGQRKAW